MVVCSVSMCVWWCMGGGVGGVGVVVLRGLGWGGCVESGVWAHNICESCSDIFVLGCLIVVIYFFVWFFVYV